MLWLPILSMVGLAFAQAPTQFNCNNLLPMGFSSSAAQPNVNGFALAPILANPSPQFKAGDRIKVVLRSTSVAISQFILQTRTASSNKVVGSWELDSEGTKLSTCSHYGDTVESTSSSSSTMEVEAVWLAPFTQDGVEDVYFIATVLSPTGVITNEIRSSAISELRQPDVHDDPRETEHEHVDDGEQEGGINNEEEEQENPNGGEDPNEPERIEEEERQESLDRDHVGGEVPATPPSEEEGMEDDHGLNREIQLQIEWQRKRDELNRLEEQQGEGSWVIVEEERRREDEALRNWEMWKYEHDQEEYERRRLEMMRWEMKDKEEHDMAEHEGDNHPNDTPKDDGEEDTAGEEDLDKEVDLGQDVPVVGDGGVSIVACIVTMTMVLAAVFLL